MARIVAVDVPAEIAGEVGLAPVKMDRLGQVVVLAGRNGGGKSRLLRLLQTLAPKSNGVEHLKVQIGNARKTLEHVRLAAYERANLDRNLSHFEQELLKAKAITWAPAPAPVSPTIVSYVPEAKELTDSFDRPPSVLRNAVSGLASPGLDNAETSAIPYIHQILEQGWAAGDPRDSGPPQDRERLLNDADRLVALIKTMLGFEPKYNSRERRIRLTNAPTDHASLSQGQRVLLQFAVALHAQEARLSEAVLMLDEPENHLHPAAIWEVLERLQKHAHDGQIWIATHSVPLLARVPPESLWTVNEGVVKHCGRQPEHVLESLLGGEEGMHKVSVFLSLPAQLSAVNFAAECLCPPTTVGEIADPQSAQLSLHLARKMEAAPVRVLDCGAGQGRLLRALREASKDLVQLRRSLDYIAFDITDADRAPCEAAIAEFYQEEAAGRRWFNRESDLRAAVENNSVHIAVMCNVLHEIDPRHWIPVLGKGSTLEGLLSNDGHLLIAEDHLMPHGELAHSQGFLVLDTGPLRKLFGASPDEIPVPATERDGRLKAHIVPARLLKQVSTATIGAALREAWREALERVKELRRGDDRSYKAGMAHAFWVQQLANATSALQELGVIEVKA